MRNVTEVCDSSARQKRTARFPAVSSGAGVVWVGWVGVGGKSLGERIKNGHDLPSWMGGQSSGKILGPNVNGNPAV